MFSLISTKLNKFNFRKNILKIKILDIVTDNYLFGGSLRENKKIDSQSAFLNLKKKIKKWPYYTKKYMWDGVIVKKKRKKRWLNLFLKNKKIKNKFQDTIYGSINKKQKNNGSVNQILYIVRKIGIIVDILNLKNYKNLLKTKNNSIFETLKMYDIEKKILNLELNLYKINHLIFDKKKINNRGVVANYVSYARMYGEYKKKINFILKLENFLYCYNFNINMVFLNKIKKYMNFGLINKDILKLNRMYFDLRFSNIRYAISSLKNLNTAIVVGLVKEFKSNMYFYSYVEGVLIKKYIFFNKMYDMGTEFIYDSNAGLFNYLDFEVLKIKKIKTKIRERFVCILIRLLNLNNFVKEGFFSNLPLLKKKLQIILNFLILNSNTLGFNIQNKKIKKYLIFSSLGLINLENIKMYIDNQFKLNAEYANLEFRVKKIKESFNQLDTSMHIKKITSLIGMVNMLIFESKSKHENVGIPLLQKNKKNNQFWDIENFLLYKKNQKEYLFLKNKKKLKTKKK